jgi:hypothetical protein
MPAMPKATVRPGYKPQSEDTSIDADVLMFYLLRNLTPLQKAQRMINFNRSLRRLALLGIKDQYPDATPAQVRQEFIKRCLGAEWLAVLKNENGRELVIEDPIGLAQKIADILDSLNIPYAVGGSVASSLLGENRGTQDIDIVIDVSGSQSQLGELALNLVRAMEENDFYVSFSAVEDALKSSMSFNVIQRSSLEKADIFVLGQDPFSVSKISRRQMHDTGIYIYSPEDIILQKLRWYKMSPTESPKQWRDILGVLKVQGERLDFDYLWQWAEKLGLSEPFGQAVTDAGLA